MAAPAIIGGTLSLASMIGSNIGAGLRADKDRQQNYTYNELSAENAYARQRELYEDFYSPSALVRQYQEAGLSPALMFGGAPGQGGSSAPQGNGAGGIQTPYYPVNLMEALQAKLLEAQVNKTNEEAKNIATDTARQDIQKGIEKLAAGQYESEWTLLNSTWVDGEGKESSLFELARESYTYNEFMEHIKNNNTDPSIREAAQTEAGQKILRQIYMGANEFTRNILVLSEEGIKASFQQEIIKALEDQNFADLNAQAAVQALRTQISTQDLTEQQKRAWNALLEHFGEKGSTGRNIALILGMILMQSMQTVGGQVTGAAIKAAL